MYFLATSKWVYFHHQSRGRGRGPILISIYLGVKTIVKHPNLANRQVHNTILRESSHGKLHGVAGAKCVHNTNLSSQSYRHSDPWRALICWVTGHELELRTNKQTSPHSWAWEVCLPLPLPTGNHGLGFFSKQWKTTKRANRYWEPVPGKPYQSVWDLQIILKLQLMNQLVIFF